MELEEASLSTKRVQISRPISLYTQGSIYCQRISS